MSEQQSADDFLRNTHGVSEAHLAQLTAQMDQAMAWEHRAAVIGREIRRASAALDWPMVEHLSLHIKELFAEVGITDSRGQTAVAAVISHLGNLLLAAEKGTNA
ncbi:MAG TPA: hypothetical protein VN133_13730 [Humibacter sp.]|nr:hypothetical protein [Humibacter sp.]